MTVSPNRIVIGYNKNVLFSFYFPFSHSDENHLDLIIKMITVETKLTFVEYKLRLMIRNN